MYTILQSGSNASLQSTSITSSPRSSVLSTHDLMLDISQRLLWKGPTQTSHANALAPSNTKSLHSCPEIHSSSLTLQGLMKRSIGKKLGLLKGTHRHFLWRSKSANVALVRSLPGGQVELVERVFLSSQRPYACQSSPIR